MAGPISVEVKFDANKAMDTIGTWVAALVARLRTSSDTKAKKIVPTLASKLATQAGLNTAFAVQLEEWPFAIYRSEEKMRELVKGMKEIVALLKSIDPQFGGANSDLIASLTASINFKEAFLWKTKDGNLFDDKFRESVAEGMHSQAEKLKEAANALATAAGLRSGPVSGPI